eukprot:Clim_evm85s153 gene=Clim_evmTU85s153
MKIQTAYDDLGKHLVALYNSVGLNAEHADGRVETVVTFFSSALREAIGNAFASDRIGDCAVLFLYADIINFMNELIQLATCTSLSDCYRAMIRDIMTYLEKPGREGNNEILFLCLHRVCKGAILMDHLSCEDVLNSISMRNTTNLADLMCWWDIVQGLSESLPASHAPSMPEGLPMMVKRILSCPDTSCCEDNSEVANTIHQMVRKIETVAIWLDRPIALLDALQRVVQWIAGECNNSSLLLQLCETFNSLLSSARVKDVSEMKLLSTMFARTIPFLANPPTGDSSMLHDMLRVRLECTALFGSFPKLFQKCRMLVIELYDSTTWDLTATLLFCRSPFLFRNHWTHPRLKIAMSEIDTLKIDDHLLFLKEHKLNAERCLLYIHTMPLFIPDPNGCCPRKSSAFIQSLETILYACESYMRGYFKDSRALAESWRKCRAHGCELDGTKTCTRARSHEGRAIFSYLRKNLYSILLSLIFPGLPGEQSPYCVPGYQGPDVPFRAFACLGTLCHCWCPSEFTYFLDDLGVRSSYGLQQSHRRLMSALRWSFESMHLQSLLSCNHALLFQAYEVAMNQRATQQDLNGLYSAILEHKWSGEPVNVSSWVRFLSQTPKSFAGLVLVGYFRKTTSVDAPHHRSIENALIDITNAGDEISGTTLWVDEHKVFTAADSLLPLSRSMKLCATDVMYMLAQEPPLGDTSPPSVALLSLLSVADTTTDDDPLSVDKWPGGPAKAWKGLSAFCRLLWRLNYFTDLVYEKLPGENSLRWHRDRGLDQHGQLLCRLHRRLMHLVIVHFPEYATKQPILPDYEECAVLLFATGCMSDDSKFSELNTDYVIQLLLAVSRAEGSQILNPIHMVQNNRIAVPRLRIKVWDEWWTTDSKPRRGDCEMRGPEPCTREEAEFLAYRTRRRGCEPLPGHLPRRIVMAAIDLFHLASVKDFIEQEFIRIDPEWKRNLSDPLT